MEYDEINEHNFRNMLHNLNSRRQDVKLWQAGVWRIENSKGISSYMTYTYHACFIYVSPNYNSENLLLIKFQERLSKIFRYQTWLCIRLNYLYLRIWWAHHKKHILSICRRLYSNIQEELWREEIGTPLLPSVISNTDHINLGHRL